MRPRPYLSYTQMTLWEKNPQAYKEIYLLGKPIPINRGMALGKELAEALEHDIETGDAAKDLVIALLPKFELMDKEIKMELKDGKKSVPLLIRPDSCKADYSAFYEYKTGPEETWNQKKVDGWDQLTFYATGLYIITKKIPAMELIVAPTTKDDEGRPSLTGTITRYQTQRAFGEIINMMVRMRKAWKGIGEMVENELI